VNSVTRDEYLAFRGRRTMSTDPKIALATLTQCSGCASMAVMPHKAPIPGWVWRLRIEAALKKRPRLVLANKIADLRALPKVQQPSKLPKDVLKPALSWSVADNARKSCCR
jgi:hypothetical protein